MYIYIYIYIFIYIRGPLKYTIIYTPLPGRFMKAAPLPAK